MCYKKHIKDIVAEISDELYQQVYEEYNLNLTYKFFLQGYSSAWIEYQFMDPMIPHTQHFCRSLRDSHSYELGIHSDINGFVALFRHLL